MEKKLILSFSNDRSISLKLLKTISIDLQGCCYSSRRYEDDDSGVILYYPKSNSLLFYNSFLPIIAVKVEASSSGLVLIVVGKLIKSVRFILSFFYVILGLLQCFLIKTCLDGFLETPFAAFIPVIIFAFLFILSSIIKYFATKAFAVKYRAQIENHFLKDKGT